MENNVRHGLNGDLGFTDGDRAENVRELVLEDDFIEIYCKCPIFVCELRDIKGYYKRARSGEIKNFTGVSSPYEGPKNPELIVETDRMSLKECVDKIDI